MSELARLERKVDRLTKLVEQKQKSLWVKASVITGLTGWTKDKMNKARENGYVSFEIRDKGDRSEYWYDLNSLNERFIKKHA